MKRLLAAALLLACSLAQAQFAPNTVLRAQDLNAALAHPTITGGSINGSPIGGSVPRGITATTINVGTITAAVIVGSVTSVSFANTATNVSGPAQPLITSVGTLTGLTVTAPIVGSVTGSAATATTATNVNGGTANVTTLAASSTSTLGTVTASVLRAGAGSVTVPSFAFTADTDTGLYNFAPGYIGIATDGVLNALFGGNTMVLPGSLDVGGTLTASFFNGGSVTYAVSAGTASYAAQAGTASFATTAGTASAVTSVGTLAGLTVTGTVNAGSVSASVGTFTSLTVGGLDVAPKIIPQNSQSANYTTTLADSGKMVFHPSADTTTRSFVISANASVAYPVGTAITFVNQNAAGVLTISVATDTMRLAGAGTTGNRTLVANGIAVAVKITTTEWIISGTGLT